MDMWMDLEKAFEDKGLNRRIQLLRSMCFLRLDNFNSMESYVNQFMFLPMTLISIHKGVNDEFLSATMPAGLSTEYELMIMAMKHSGVHAIM